MTVKEEKECGEKGEMGVGILYNYSKTKNMTRHEHWDNKLKL